MADETWVSIYQFVAGDVPAPPPPPATSASDPTVIKDRDLTQLRTRLHKLQQAPGDTPAPSDDPGVFAEAVQAREFAAQQRDDEGQPLPRWNDDKPGMKQLYQAHDALVQLPNPGGIGLLVVVVAVFFVILIPATAAGETRGLLLWDVLLGKKEIQGGDPPVVTIDGIYQQVAGAISGGIGAIGGIAAGIGLVDTGPELGMPSGSGSGGIV